MRALVVVASLCAARALAPPKRAALTLYRDTNG